MLQVGFPSGRHAGLQDGPCLILRQGKRGSRSVISVIGGPVELIPLVAIVNRVLCPIPTDVDKCE
jgi:hypothetical protein